MRACVFGNVRVRVSTVTVLLYLLLSATIQAQSPEWSPVGEIRIGGSPGRILFSEEESRYRIDVVGDPSMDGDQIDVWLLSKGGKALEPKLLGQFETNNSGSVIWTFDRTVDRAALVGIVVAVSGVPTLFRIPTKAPAR
jgi:hypothetical protein